MGFYFYIMVKKPHNIPVTKPTTTCDNECCMRIIRLEPTIPAIMMTRHIHPIGLKAKRKEKATKAPSTPPIAAVCVDTFHHILIMAHITCMANAAKSIRAIKLGMCIIIIR